MIFKTKRTILFIFFLLFYSISFSQVGIQGGYNVGSYAYSLRNMEILSYEFNQSHPNYTDKFNFTNLYHGITVIFYKNSYNIGMDMGWELKWSGKVITSSAQGADNPGDTVFKHQLRASMSTIAYGWYVNPYKHLKLGIDWDVDISNFTKKIGPADNFKAQKKQAIYTRRGFFVVGGTFFADFQLGPVRVRPYYQFDFFQGETHYGENDYAFKINNFGIALFIGTESKD